MPQMYAMVRQGNWGQLWRVVDTGQCVGIRAFYAKNSTITILVICNL